MNFSLVKDASKFAYNELYKNTESWFMLCLKVVLLVFAMIIGTILIAVPVLLVFANAIGEGGGIKNVGKIINVITIILVAVIGIFMALVKIINIAFIPFANAFDVAQGKPMRKFENKMTSSALLLATVLTVLAVLFGLVLLIIPGIIFLVRFSLAPFIIIDERCGAMEAMSKSWKLTKNNLAVLFPVIVWTGILRCIPIINVLVYLFPFNDLTMSYAYVSLKEKQ
ncbi:MAG: YciC family protein [Candidatus Dependentiae bacterium]|nr:YciC family protein [Candidatus Dependentiae bacterium]